MSFHFGILESIREQGASQPHGFEACRVYLPGKTVLEAGGFANLETEGRAGCVVVSFNKARKSHAVKAMDKVGVVRRTLGLGTEVFPFLRSGDVIA